MNCIDFNDQYMLISGASDKQLKTLGSNFDIPCPSILLSLLKIKNGGIPLHEDFFLLSVEDIIEDLEVNAVDSHWNNSYIPFAKNEKNDFLIIQMEKGLFY